MNFRTVALTLWDLLKQHEPPTIVIPKNVKQKVASKQRPIQAKYDGIVVKMKDTYGFRIRKWRTSMSGCAWELKDKNGNIYRMLESPYPKGPMSCAIFLHEVGHHAIGFHTYKPRCLEEYFAWEWSLAAMKANDINITANVLKRRDNALQYAVAKALRRGLKRVPVELESFIPAQYRIAS
ncbi:MAG TPA: hypothetical protein EYO01_08540 [Phycisphaerales bacterium]|nr:hypothetical protein [Phycisphaerales bacterium]HIB00585.1 hypothetical protein [Phycisphaerales bacterium]HIO53255.1 hypothetical protein [Phycisphaerales bacterium]